MTPHQLPQPRVSALPDEGKVGIFVGTGYRLLPPADARLFAQRVIAAAQEIESGAEVAR